MKAIGVAKLIGVKAIPIVRGNRNIPTTAMIARITNAPPIPELKRDPSEVSTVQAAPKYENNKLIPAKNPIISITFPSISNKDI